MQSFLIFDTKTRNEFNEFIDLQSTKEWHTALTTDILIFFFCLIAVFNFFKSFDESQNSVLATLGLVLVSLSWVIRIVIYSIKYLKNGMERNTLLVSFESLGLFLLILSIEIVLISRVLNGSCASYSSQWMCNPEYESQMIPIQQMVVIMFAPIYYSVLFQSRMMLNFIVWISVMVSLLFSFCIVGFTEPSLIAFSFYASISILLLMQIRSQRVTNFFRSKQLQFLLSENERLAEENLATELRHMIGNVAHDLKTVSFYKISQTLITI
jgi:hypothetical protein